MVDIIIILILAIAIALAIYRIVKNKKSGKCPGCSYSSTCSGKDNCNCKK